MDTDNSESPERLWFPARIRELRIAAGKKQRQIAVAVGMAERSYANAESSNFKRMRLERVHRLARFHNLGPLETEELVRGWEALPESPYNKRMAKPWAERNARRAKLKMHEPLKLRLLCMTTLLITNVADPGSLCTCGEVDMFAPESSGQQECDLCDALRLLGLEGWTNLDDVVAKLAAVQEAMTG